MLFCVVCDVRLGLKFVLCGCVCCCIAWCALRALRSLYFVFCVLRVSCDLCVVYRIVWMVLFRVLRKLCVAFFVLRCVLSVGCVVLLRVWLCRV